MSEQPTQYKYEFIKTKQVLEITSISRAHLFNLLKLGKFPKPIKMGMHINVFEVSEVYKWMEEKLESRNSTFTGSTKEPSLSLCDPPPARSVNKDSILSQHTNS